MARKQTEADIKRWLKSTAAVADQLADQLDPRRDTTKLPERKRLIVHRLDAIAHAANHAHTILRVTPA